MNSKQIESLFTEKVAEYIMNGYTINTATMEGHQGEISKVDLRKGGEIIRIYLDAETDWANNWTREYVVLIVGRYSGKLRSRSPFDTMCDTIWNKELEVIEERKFYHVDRSADNFTENVEEVDAMILKQHERWRNRRDDDTVKLTSDKAVEIALRYVRKQPRCKGCKASDITEIRRFGVTRWNTRMHYSVTLKNGRSYKIA